jgi:CheY-like chemotaxis protein
VIFDNFSQTETGVQSRKGTGLGLAISKSFVELMGGGIEVESEIGAGTVFRFSLPCKEIIGSQSSDEGRPISLPAPRRKRLAPGHPEIRILIAEDQPANRLLAKRILLSAGFSVEEAENGAEAVDKWRSCKPDLILMDEEMPVMRGAEAVRIIRSEGKDDAIPKIISLTAFALDEARAAAFKSGCDDFLAKPFKSDVLIEMIARHLSIQFETGEILSGTNAA